MIGSIAGDIIGSVYEGRPIKTINFPLFSNHSTFTDDTVLTVATAFSILNGVDYVTSYRKFGRKYPEAGYGMSFYQWIYSSEGPYNSWGNGSAMRVSPVGYAFNSIKDVLSEAEKCASVTHNHPEGIKGAQAAALSIFLAVNGESKESIKKEISQRFVYNLDRKLDEIRPEYSFDVSCQGSVPESIVAFLESENVEDAIRKGISLGGDSDTMACIAGGIAQAFYNKIPEEIITNARKRLPDEFLEIIDEFNTKFRVLF
ncbi:MAG: ADP-ribosylglycohydrolase family protein [Desulfobacterales bacterium]|jgi:ADP-ribosyl-[dinitrogen reductase] hydrolase|nr:ADP-ribosylglycohydrolase family protein [Desulfobacteraceae bacterium]MBT4363034.1 ADP-ribosylglycohydrolase family protein [Desulfobacteraceae bacterium]MBT7084587.1 ADP-ribosylglycohydrolase family protein [Desulfobacterales bacterium]MBT7697657.1 ADP-ribosylglycohydrolase family protein [Desulfobacterales bacterium]